MKKIENQPLTDFSQLPIKIATTEKLDLTKSNLPPEQQEDLVKKLLQEIGKLKDSGKIIIAQSHNESSFVMAKITPSKNKHRSLIFPEPNPVIIYYNTAVSHIENALQIQQGILAKDWSPDELYPVFTDFFAEAFQGITQLTMSLESLFNQKNPEDIALLKGEKTLRKRAIEWMSLKEKYRYLLPIITGVDIHSNHNNDYQNIIKLSSVRNDLIHLKSLMQENFTYYQSLYKELIDLDFERFAISVHNVIDLLNR